jgi:hypothetical protein
VEFAAKLDLSAARISAIIFWPLRQTHSLRDLAAVADADANVTIQQRFTNGQG